MRCQEYPFRHLKNAQYSTVAHTTYYILKLFTYYTCCANAYANATTYVRSLTGIAYKECSYALKHKVQQWRGETYPIGCKKLRHPEEPLYMLLSGTFI
jgi:hypothetical protein